MYPVCLKKFPFVAKSIQQERHQFESMAFRELRVYILKLLSICYAIIRRQLHPGQQYCGFISQAGFDDGFEIITDGFDGRSSQPIVTTQFDNYDGSMGLYRLLDPLSTSRRRFATDAIVDQRCVGFCLQPPLQQADPSCIVRQAIASGQTVPKYHNSSGSGCGGGLRRRCRA